MMIQLPYTCSTLSPHPCHQYSMHYYFKNKIDIFHIQPLLLLPAIAPVSTLSALYSSLSTAPSKHKDYLVTSLLPFLQWMVPHPTQSKSPSSQSTIRPHMNWISLPSDLVSCSSLLCPHLSRNWSSPYVSNTQTHPSLRASLQGLLHQNVTLFSPIICEVDILPLLSTYHSCLSSAF